MYDLKSTPKRSAGRWQLSLTTFVGVLCLSVVFGAAACQAANQSSRPAKRSKSVRNLPLIHVLVFPPDTQGSKTEQLGDVVVDVIQSRLKLSGKYASLVFSGAIPTVKRAVSEQAINKADLNAPFYDVSKAKRLAALTGYKFIIVSTINDLDYDADKRQITVSLSIRLIDLAHGPSIAPPIEGKLSSAEKAATDDNFDAVAGETTRKLTERLVGQLIAANSASN